MLYFGVLSLRYQVCVNFKTMVEPDPSVVKHKKLMPLMNAEKRHVLIFFTKLSQDDPHIALDEVAGLVANATGISQASVCRARKELKKCWTVSYSKE
jgi:hypothetical protein